MSEKLLYGDELAANMVAEAQISFEHFDQLGRAAHFTTVLVGDDQASRKYIDMKQAEGTLLGVKMSRLDLPATISQADLETEIDAINNDKDVHAILVQYPLPTGLNYLRAIERIIPQKDVDGLHPYNLGLLMHDPAEAYPGVIACTPNGIVQLLKYAGVELDGANITVVGRGMTVGAPLSMLLSAKHQGSAATVTTVHRATKNIAEHTIGSDIVIGATGVPGLIDGSMVKPGAVLVSVGVSYDEAGKARGDFASSAREQASVYVPVTRGIGPMTRANLWKNVVRCYELQHDPENN